MSLYSNPWGIPVPVPLILMEVVSVQCSLKIKSFTTYAHKWTREISEFWIRISLKADLIQCLFTSRWADQPADQPQSPLPPGYGSGSSRWSSPPPAVASPRPSPPAEIISTTGTVFNLHFRRFSSLPRYIFYCEDKFPDLRENMVVWKKVKLSNETDVCSKLVANDRFSNPLWSANFYWHLKWTPSREE